MDVQRWGLAGGWLLEGLLLPAAIFSGSWREETAASKESLGEEGDRVHFAAVQPHRVALVERGWWCIGF